MVSAGIRCLAVEYATRHAAAAHDLAQWRVLEVGQACAPFVVRQEEIPHADLILIL